MKGRRLKNKAEAERERNALQVKLDQGRQEHAEKPVKDILFPDWIVEFEG